MVQTEVGTFPAPAACATCVPFMNQIATSPFVSCQRISLLPSPLKSPVPTIFHTLGGAFPTPADWVTWAPFISQIATSPVVVFCQRMSPVPSPLKSWVSVSLLLAERSVAELHGDVGLPMLLCVKTTAGNDSVGGTAETCTRFRLFVSP